MNITVVGGNSGTGAHVVQLAEQAGHQVTCLSRSGSASLPSHVRNLIGDALNTDVARSAIDGADAVIVAVGGAPDTDRHRTQVTQSIIAAMQEASVRRLIVHSFLGVGESVKLMPAPARVFARAMLGRALADHAAQEAAAEASGLDWTILRPGGLTDAPATGAYVAQETAEALPMKSRISRADVATHIVSILDDPTTYGKALAMGTP